MEQLELNAVDPHVVQVPDGLQHLFMIFSGKSQDYMNDHRNITPVKLFYGRFKAGEGITSVNLMCCRIMHSLKSQFDPDWFAFMT